MTTKGGIFPPTWATTPREYQSMNRGRGERREGVNQGSEVSKTE